MAEKKVIEIDVNTKDAVKAMENLSKATHDVSASFEEVYGDLQPLTTRMGEAEDRLYELANAGKTTTQEYKDLLKTVGDYRKVQIQTDLAVDAAATTMGQGLGGALGGITSGFSAAQGVMGAFGAESKAVEEALLKVQSAMAIQQGIQGIRESIPSFTKLKTAAVGAFEGMTNAGKAFAVTGIGLLITAVGVLIANYDSWFGASSKVEEQQKRISEQSKEQRQNIAQESGEFATLISRLKNTNQGTQEREDLIKKINGQYGTTLKNIKDETQFQESLNKELASYLEYQKAKYQLQKNEELIVKNLEKQDLIQSKISKASKDLPALIEAQKKAQKGLNETNAQDTNMVAFYAEKVREAKAAVAAKNKEIKLEQDELAKAEKRFNAYGSAANNAAKNVDKITNSGTKYVEQNTKVIESNNEVEKSVTEKVQTEEEAEALRTEQLVKWNQEALDKKKLSEEEYAEWKRGYDEEQRKWEEDWNQKKIDAEIAVADTLQQVRMKDIENIQAGISLISNLFEGNKKVQAAALIAQNAVSIAKTIIETKASNQAARAQGTALSIVTGGASVAAAEALILRNNIGAGISIAGIIAATGKGLSALKAGGSPSGGGNLNEGGGGGGGGTMSPSFNVVGNSGINQLAQLQQQPSKAYVVSGDVTTAQSLDRNRIENATLVQ